MCLSIFLSSILLYPNIVSHNYFFHIFRAPSLFTSSLIYAENDAQSMSLTPQKKKSRILTNNFASIELYRCKSLNNSGATELYRSKIVCRISIELQTSWKIVSIASNLFSEYSHLILYFISVCTVLYSLHLSTPE